VSMTECLQILCNQIQQQKDERNRLCSRAIDPDATPNELRSLVQHKDPYVRWAIVYNRTSPSDALAALAGDEDLDVKGMELDRLLNHPNTPPLVKIWLRGGYGEMSLEQFLKAAQ